jgi:Protein of unknown function (DUF998)
LALSGAVVAITGALTFLAVVGWLHIRRPDLDSRIKGVSHYAGGETRTATTAAFVALSLGLLGSALAIGARTGSWMNPGMALVGLAALGLLVVAAIPVSVTHDATWRGRVHAVGALVFFIGSAAGLVLVSPALGTCVTGVSQAIVAVVVCFLLSMAGVPGLFAVRGWLQRGCFAGIVAWLLIAGGQLAS